MNSLKKLSVIIPSRNEAENLPDCLIEISKELKNQSIDHEILIIDDGSTDKTYEVVESLKKEYPAVFYVKNSGENGFGRAVQLGLQTFSGDAVAIMMADRSDSPRNLVEYWNELKDGTECVLGSRFHRGSHVQQYPVLKLVANRIVNTLIRYAFNIEYNDVTNAFKIYRRGNRRLQTLYCTTL